MIALVYAENIIEGRYEYKDVPNLWKDKVNEILIQKGHEDLITE